MLQDRRVNQVVCNGEIMGTGGFVFLFLLRVRVSDGRWRAASQHRIATFFLLLFLCLMLRDASQGSRLARERRNLSSTRRRTPTKRPRDMTLEHGKRDFLQHRHADYGRLAGRKSPAWMTSRDTPTCLTTTPFLCGPTLYNRHILLGDSIQGTL